MDLYISSFSFSLNDEEPKKLFSKIGNVPSAKKIFDHMTGLSRVFGFVEMNTENSKAIGRLNVEMKDDKSISVAEAKPRFY